MNYGREDLQKNYTVDNLFDLLMSSYHYYRDSRCDMDESYDCAIGYLAGVLQTDTATLRKAARHDAEPTIAGHAVRRFGYCYRKGMLY